MITLVAAISQNNCIGKNGELPWDIPEDMKRMREITLGKIMIMGRKTWESIPENRRPLPKRTNVVITSQTEAEYPLPEGVERYATIAQAVAAHQGDDIIGFGGQKIFEEMIKIADMLDMTHVEQTVDGCTAYFPTIDPTVWKKSRREDHEGFSFVQYTRI